MKIQRAFMLEQVFFLPEGTYNLVLGSVVSPTLNKE